MAINDMNQAIAEFQNLIQEATVKWQEQVVAAEEMFVAAVQHASEISEVDLPSEQSLIMGSIKPQISKKEILKEPPPGKIFMDEEVYKDLMSKLEKIDPVIKANPALFANILN